MPKTDPNDSAGGVNLETHPLVAKLHADPDQLTDLVALVGYLGPSKREGYVRLYVDLTFRNYYEIPTEGIVSTSPTDASDENSPTTLHVAGDTQVDKVSITSQSTEARFLQGSISSGYLSGADAGAQAAAVDWPGSPTCWCGSHTCQPGAAQAAQPYTDTIYHTCACTYGQATCNNCGVAGAQVNAQAWPPSPSCYGTCWQPNCGQAGAQANVQAWPPSPTCWGCHTGVPCGQGGVQAQAGGWPASPTCWCNFTRNCNQQAQTGYTNTVGYTCICSYVNCGQAATPGKVEAWPVTGACHYTQWRACGQGGAQANAAEYWTMGATCLCATQIQCNTSQGCT